MAVNTLNPFKRAPKKLVVKRMTGPLVGVFLISFLAMGIVASSPLVRDNDRKPSSFIPAFEVPETSAAMAVARVKQAAELWTHIPTVCWTGNTVNEFQSRQCEDWWVQLGLATGLCLLPFACCALFALAAVDQVSAFYRRSRKRIDKGKALFAGVVTEPAEAPNDFFGWSHGLRAISLELSNKKQMTVYIPLDAPVPLPGQQLAVFDGGKCFGAKRHVGLLYAPHLMIIGAG